MTGVSAQIKSILSMEVVANRYGLHPNQAGYILCPFHAEKTPSLKIYSEPGGGFHCYSCQAGGSVLDFVMRLFQINLQQAIVRLNADFGLGLTPDRPDRRATERFYHEQAAKKQTELAAQTEIQWLTEYHCATWWALKNNPVFSDVWCRSQLLLEYLNYRLEVATCQTASGSVGHS